MHPGLAPDLPLHEWRKVKNDDHIDRSSSVVSTWRQWLGLFALSTVAPAEHFAFSTCPGPPLDRFGDSPEPRWRIPLESSVRLIPEKGN